MTATFQIKDILRFLDENQIAYSVKGDLEESTQYKFASTKNIIKNGIYYFQDSLIVEQFPITDSILLIPEQTKSTNITIVVDNPQLVHYKLSTLAAPLQEYSIANSSKISPNAHISNKVSIGENCVIGDAILEEGVIIKHNVVIEDNVTIKKGSFIDSNSVIGAIGLSWIWDEYGTRVRQPQIGGVIIGENCHLGTDITVVRGSLSENTTIGDYTVIAHGSKIGHGAQLGENVHLANNVSLAGNSKIGDYSFLGSASIVSSNVSIPKHTIVGAGAMVHKSLIEEYTTLAGIPAKVIKRNNFENKPQGAPKPFKKI